MTDLSFKIHVLVRLLHFYHLLLLEYDNQSSIGIFKETLILINPLFAISAMYDLPNASLDHSFDVLRLDREIALAQGSIGDNIQ